MCIICSVQRWSVSNFAEVTGKKYIMVSLPSNGKVCRWKGARNYFLFKPYISYPLKCKHDAWKQAIILTLIKSKMAVYEI